MNYSEIVAAIIAYSDRSDAATTGTIDSFLRMAEARINRLIRNEEMSTELDIPVVALQSEYALPADYAGMRSISIETAGAITPLQYLNPESTDWLVDSDEADVKYYTIRSQNIELMKPPSAIGSNIRIHYFQKIPALTAAAPTNWFADLHPDIYLSGAMVELCGFLKNYDSAAKWNEKFAAALDECGLANWNDKWSGTPMFIKVAE